MLLASTSLMPEVQPVTILMRPLTCGDSTQHGTAQDQHVVEIHGCQNVCTPATCRYVIPCSQATCFDVVHHTFPLEAPTNLLLPQVWPSCRRCGTPQPL
jgi:hypothetical protein